MDNPRLGVLAALGALNPKRGKKMSVRRRRRTRKGHSARHMAWVRSHRKSNRRRRRNPMAMVNRRRRHHHRRSYRRHRRNSPWGLLTNRRRRRNPRRSSGGRSFFGLPPLQSVLFVGAGFVAVPAFETFLNTWLPTSITSTTLGKYAVRIGLVLGITALGRALMGKDRAKLVAIGGG